MLPNNSDSLLIHKEHGGCKSPVELRNWGDNLEHVPCAGGANVLAPRETKGSQSSFGASVQRKSQGSFFFFPIKNNFLY